MIAEYKTVCANAKKCEDFIYDDPQYDKMDRNRQKLACQQLAFMEGYAKTLKERIELEGLTIK